MILSAPVLFAALPEWVPMFAVICIVVAVVAILGLLLLLRGLQEFRKRFAEEMGLHLNAKKEPAPVAVQSPLVITEHQHPVTRAELEKVDTQLHGRLKRERAEIDDEIRRVATAAEKRSDELAKDLKENTSLTSNINGKVEVINQSMVQLNTTLTTFLQRQATK